MTTRRSLAAAFAFLSLLRIGAEAKPDEARLQSMNGIIVVVEDRIITADELRREMGPLVEHLRALRGSADFPTPAPSSSRLLPERMAGDKTNTSGSAPFAKPMAGKVAAPIPSNAPPPADQTTKAQTPTR
ncbi:MAG TPA: hypothetical protein VG734_15875 [Lacunisphaera sp.]|nr:hypothetical protein [Lacunisphaera sp.]